MRKPITVLVEIFRAQRFLGLFSGFAHGFAQAVGIVAGVSATLNRIVLHIALPVGVAAQTVWPCNISASDACTFDA